MPSNNTHSRSNQGKLISTMLSKFPVYISISSQNAIRAKKQAEKEQDEREDNESVDNEDESSGLLDLISNEANTKSGIV